MDNSLEITKNLKEFILNTSIVAYDILYLKKNESVEWADFNKTNSPIRKILTIKFLLTII